MHLIYQKMGFKVQELKKENFLMEWANVYVLFKNKKHEIFVPLYTGNWHYFYIMIKDTDKQKWNHT